MNKLEPCVVELKDANVGYGRFRNFSGQISEFNQNGERSFALWLDQETAEFLDEKGFNVKWPKPMENKFDEPDKRSPFLMVKVRYRYANGELKPADRAPYISLLFDGDRKEYDELTVHALDNLRLINCDVKINGYISKRFAQNSTLVCELVSLVGEVDTSNYVKTYVR